MTFKTLQDSSRQRRCRLGSFQQWHALCTKLILLISYHMRVSTKANPRSALHKGLHVTVKIVKGIISVSRLKMLLNQVTQSIAPTTSVSVNVIFKDNYGNINSMLLLYLSIYSGLLLYRFIDSMSSKLGTIKYRELYG